MAIIRITPAGDLDLRNRRFQAVSGVQHTRQRLASRFKFFRGSWFADLRMGVPYYQTVLVKNPDLTAITTLFRRVAVTTPRIESLERFRFDFDEVERRGAFDFHAHSSDGPIIVTPDDEDFVFEVT